LLRHTENAWREHLDAWLTQMQRRRMPGQASMQHHECVSDRPPRRPKSLMRLDVHMVERGLVGTRARAQDLIRRGLVEVDGSVERRPAASVGGEADIRVIGAAARDVSRGAAKLVAALDHFRFAAAGAVALDIGASTGGFTQVLLDRGAARVYAVDVGHGQLDARLAADPRVVALEGCDARRLDRALVPEPVGAIVADVSFISLTKALPAALCLAAPGAWLVALIKPQFEAGREFIGKGGIVRSETARRHAVDLVRGWVAQQPGWRVLDVIGSPIAGKSGNAEFLLGAVKDGG
jgi:23S rRNA (cytidine1920-2'-O)/16S rRNA (cytidine1409-2'-O)-methyltransferase